MPRNVVGLIGGRFEEVRSGFIHKFPFLWNVAADPQDRVLRWRVGGRSTIPDTYWVNFRNSNAGRGISASRQNIVIGVKRSAYDFTLADIKEEGSHMAVAYHLGGVTMIGINERSPDDEIFNPVNRDGTPSPDGEYMGVALHDRGGTFSYRRSYTGWEAYMADADRLYGPDCRYARRTVSGITFCSLVGIVIRNGNTTI